MVGIKLTKKGQVFTLDYIMGFIMFMVVAIIAGKQLINILPSTNYAELYDENNYFSNTLLQPGYPYDWTPSNVLIPGISSSNRLDSTKLAYFDSFTYDETKSFFHIRNDYIFYFQKNNSIVFIGASCMFGYALSMNISTCEPDLDSLGYQNVVKSSRLLIYNSSIVDMVLISWN